MDSEYQRNTKNGIELHINLGTLAVVVPAISRIDRNVEGLSKGIYGEKPQEWGRMSQIKLPGRYGTCYPNDEEKCGRHIQGYRR